MSGKRIFVTGGAGGLGRAIALRYQRAGYRVCIGDVNESALLSCGREDLLRQCGPPASGVWKLARRTIFADESVLRMQNLAVFL